MEALYKNNTWNLVKLPLSRTVIGNRWIFKIKRDELGNLDCYKARLVIRGCFQQKDFDYDEAFDPGARLTTVRT